MPNRRAKFQDLLSYPPRAMRAERAAAYFDMSKSAFLDLVARGILPKPTRIGGIVTWDRLVLDLAYEEIAAVDDKPNSFDVIIDGLKHG
jgi:predicted DNA-binding transcriptional regulator AlpA